jgi:uncharacterized protein (DUF2147 family)
MLRRFAMIALPLAAMVGTTSTAQSSANIAGRWRTDDGNAIIHVAPCAGNARQYCGRIAQMTNPTLAQATDTNNPDSNLRSRPLVGVPVLTNLSAEGQRFTGRGYSPEEGRNFNATVHVENGRLNVRGCVAVFCRTVVWTRAQ